MLVHDLGLSRRACDRCHGQKLRCKRENNNEGCLRCQRAGVQCIPRLVRSQRRVRSQVPQPSPTHGHNPTQSLVSPANEQGNQDVSEPFHGSPSGLLDIPSDLDLGLDFSSLQPDIGHPPETFDSQSGIDFATLQDRHFSQSFAQVPPYRRGVGRSDQEHQTELLAPFQDPCTLSAPASAMMPRFSEAPPSCTRPRKSIARDTTLQSLNRQSQRRANTGLTSFNGEDQGQFHTPDSDSSDTESSSAPTSANCPQSMDNGMCTSHGTAPPTAKPTTNSMNSWIRRLSDVNVELHQHMHSIPSVELGQSSWTNTNGKRTANDQKLDQQNQELAIDRTLQLSQRYTEILNDIFSGSKIRQTHAGPTTPIPQLDQPSQLLVLSSYLCLVECYDKILQHLKTWTKVRLKTGVSMSNHHLSIQLPSLAIGSFQLPTSSSSRALVLTCIIETMVVQIHNLVGEMTKPVNGRDGSGRSATTAASKHDTTGGSGLYGIAEANQQAIRAREESTMELIQVIWRLALRCGSP